MTLQIEFWQLMTFLGTFLMLMLGMGKLLLVQFGKRTDAQHNSLSERLKSIDDATGRATTAAHQLERDFLSFKADLPMQYVMRDDYIRGQSIIEAKLDGLADKLEKAQLRGVISGGMK